MKPSNISSLNIERILSPRAGRTVEKSLTRVVVPPLAFEDVAEARGLPRLRRLREVPVDRRADRYQR